MRNFAINSTSLLFLFYSLISAELPEPVFSSPDTIFQIRLKVSMYTLDSSWIVFTTDGSIPKINGKNSTHIGNDWEFEFDSTVTIKAMAFMRDTTSEGIIFYDTSTVKTVTYAKRLTAPVIWNNEYDFEDSIVVKLSHSEVGVSIYYTIDGSDPVLKGLLYKEPIVIKKTTEIKYLATKPKCVNSKTLSKNLIKTSVNIKKHFRRDNILKEKAILLTHKSTMPLHVGRSILFALNGQVLKRLKINSEDTYSKMPVYGIFILKPTDNAR